MKKGKREKGKKGKKGKRGKREKGKKGKREKGKKGREDGTKREKGTVVDYLTRPGPEARRIWVVANPRSPKCRVGRTGGA